jgi:hypothetical protein
LIFERPELGFEVLEAKLGSLKYQLSAIVVAAMLGAPAVPKIGAALLSVLRTVH